MQLDMSIYNYNLYKYNPIHRQVPNTHSPWAAPAQNLSGKHGKISVQNGEVF